MAYEPKEWVCGDTITADDLNRIEDGVADASNLASELMIVHLNKDAQSGNITSDTPYNDIFEHLNAGKIAIGAARIMSGESVVAVTVGTISMYNGTMRFGNSKQPMWYVHTYADDEWVEDPSN